MRIIAGRLRGRRLEAPKGRNTRPTTDRNREALFSALSHQLGHDFSGLRVLDLFAGSGALGLEALSRGAGHVTFIERAHPALEALKANVETLKAAPDTQVIKGDAMTLPATLGTFDLILTDPPYDKMLAAKSLENAIDTDLTGEDTLLCADAALAEGEAFKQPPFAPLWSKQSGQSVLSICAII